MTTKRVDWYASPPETESGFDPVRSPLYISYSSGNKVATITDGAVAKATFGASLKSSGKRYFELINTLNTWGFGYSPSLGIADAIFVQDTGSAPPSTTILTSEFCYYGANGIIGGSSGGGAGTAFTSGDIVGVAIDFDAGKIWVSKNNTWQLGGVPATGASPAITFTPNRAMSPMFQQQGGGIGVGSNVALRTILSQFSYTPPSGFVSWGTAL